MRQSKYVAIIAQFQTYEDTFSIVGKKYQLVL